jgi:3-deoxy-D-manno-octulosonic-acid transferase
MLQKAGINNVLLSGDTRFDRVLQIKSAFKAIPFFETYCQHHKIIVAGSTWEGDETFLLEAFVKLDLQNLKLILVPHEVDKKSIAETQTRLKNLGLAYSLYSGVKDKVKAKVEDEKVLVLDVMGLLSSVYHYADVAYVGGGFNGGIHNLLEPAVFLKPIVFSGHDDYSKFNEALELVEMGVASALTQTNELAHTLKSVLDSPEKKEEIESQLQQYFKARSGSTQKVMDVVFA